jgi:hypothetical protein
MVFFLLLPAGTHNAAVVISLRVPTMPLFGAFANESGTPADL